MPEHGVRSPFSQCPFQLLVRGSGEEVLSAASAFFFEREGSWFVMTNWHVVSGLHFQTREPLQRPFKEPLSLTARLFSYADGDPESGELELRSTCVPLYRDEDPVWLEHPELGSSCDIVAIPMARPASCPDFMHNAANLISKDRIPVEPGSTVFVIGFPKALRVGPGLPLWKAGYVASEPHYDVCLGERLGGTDPPGGVTRIPAFFLDSLTRPGMSGSPVFARYQGPWDLDDPYRRVNPEETGFWERDDIVLSGHATQFVGCYSGRVGRTENEAALGLCWRSDVIEAICQGGRLGRNPHFVGD